MGETKENNIQQTSEQDLWQEEAAMMHIFSRNRKNNLRTLLSLFKGHYGALAGSVFFFIIKHSPTWVLPIVTANIINAVTDHNGNITKILILNTILMIVFLVQNIPTNYIHTWLYAKTVRTVEKELREALVCKLQQLSITYHKEMQSGRLQSKIMRDVEQIQNLASQIFISLLTIILNIGVLVDGNDLMELDLHSYRKQIAVVPQQSILFTGTLRENITYGSESISEEQLWNVIRAANLEEVVQKLPDGLDTMITEHGENLSGGQRQRISIARAFLRNPKILILDEATSALDSISEKKIQDSIQKLVKGRTTLIVAHRLSTIRNADRIAVIEKGNVLECGSYEELIEKKGAFYRMEKM